MKYYLGGMPYQCTSGKGGEYSTPVSQGRPKVQMNFAPNQGARGVDAIAAAAASSVPPNYAHLTPPTSPNQPQAHFSQWACDYCRAATFHSFEEARAHEEVCYYNSSRSSAVVSPHQAAASTVSTHTSMPALTLQQPSPPAPAPAPAAAAAAAAAAAPQFAQINASSSEQTDETNASNNERVVLRLYRDSDAASLSDRQCYVRKHFVEVFTATDLDVQSRHSKGAQKLHSGQVGIRCVFCMHLHPKERAERAICYPSSVSRIYQTVADMQRFHFEACHCIPEEMKHKYKTLKTTRPRGMGSPQQYWIESAFDLGLVDSENGIQCDATRANTDISGTEEHVSSPRYELATHPTSPRQHDDSYNSPSGSTSPTHSATSVDSQVSSPGMNAMLQAAELHARQQEDTRDQRNSPHQRPPPATTHGDDDAIMLLSLRHTIPSPQTQPAKSPTYRPSGV